MPSGYNSSHTGEWQDDLFNLIYPVGSIYLSVNSTNPSILFGGTWEQIQDKFLLSAGSTYAAGSTGGAASVTSGGTALTEAQLPVIDSGTIAWHGQEHGTHIYNVNGKWYGSKINNQYQTTGATSGAYSYANLGFRFGSGQAHSHTVSTMPPYLSVYVWKRTA